MPALFGGSVVSCGVVMCTLYLRGLGKYDYLAQCAMHSTWSTLRELRQTRTESPAWPDLSIYRSRSVELLDLGCSAPAAAPGTVAASVRMNFELLGSSRTASAAVGALF
jgi:hypothetical protein